MEYKVITKYNADLIKQSIELAAANSVEVLARNIVDLQDCGVREALIKLGWTPPKDSLCGISHNREYCNCTECG